MAFGYSIIALQNISNGLNKISPNNVIILDDLYTNSAVLSEAYQTILRKYNMNDAYDKLKNLTRNNNRLEILASNQKIWKIYIKVPVFYY